MGRKGAKKGKGAAPPAIVSESSRVRVGKVLEEFRASDAEVYTFEPGLSKEERAAVHEMCRKMGLRSKSSGYGDKRRLSLFKSKMRKGPMKKEEETFACLKFSEEANTILRDLFTRYPPDDGEPNEDSKGKHGEKTDKAQRMRDSTFSKPSTSKAELAKKVELHASRMKNSPNLRKISEARAKLPIASFKDVITSTLETHQVVLLTGETGCGKTTQVPQYILDHMWSKGEACKIVCTQPRRISAMSVAERISNERGESVGDTVGYKIRMEGKGGKHSSIMFCTNGVLLRVLISRGVNMSKTEDTKKSLKDALLDITHIIVDEIHERDRFSDFMLAILRDLLPSYPHLRLILMSATIDSERFSQYFNGCPTIQVPGFTHPVKSFYLEDVLSILKSVDDNHLDSATEENAQLTEEDKTALDESINMALSNDEFESLLELVSSEQSSEIYNYQHSLTGVSPLMLFAGRGRVSDVCMLLSFGADPSLRDNEGNTALDWAQSENQLEACKIIKKHMASTTSKSAKEEELLNNYLGSINPEHVDTVLIERLLKKICTDSKDGAILIFLPGWDDINQTKERLLTSLLFSDQSKFSIHSLHSMVPAAEQKKVFKRPPTGVRKIILSTNIAETAVTIDDVVYVIDTGRMKEKSYDPYSNVSTLHSSWVSKASARQREGRSGRCQPGTCYHLFSKIRAASLPEFQDPEIKRMPIEELCLQVKLLDPHCKISDFLKKTLDPPVSETVRNAIVVLQDIGALTQDEKLTDLGEKMGSLPVHPSTSKMLLLAILMNCLEPALTLACAADYREPFLLPMAPGEKKKATAARVELASLYGGYSDQLAVVAAFECWRRAKDRGQESQFCSQYFISASTMNMLSSMRKQLQTELAKSGFIPEDASSCSLNAQDPGILRAILTSGTYPMVGRLLPARKNNKRAIVETANGAKVWLHPHSCNYNLSLSKSAGSTILMYDEITRGDGGVYIKNCSLVGPYSLILIAMEMAVAPQDDNDEDSDEDGASSGEDDEMEINGTSGENEDHIMASPDNSVSVVIDRWLRFDSTALDVAKVYCLRERLSAAILFKVRYPRASLPPALGASMHAIASILSLNGLSYLPSVDESVESPAASVGGAVDTNNSTRGRRGTGQLSPSNFLRSLMSDNARSTWNRIPSQPNRAQSYPIPAGVAAANRPPSFPIPLGVASANLPHTAPVRKAPKPGRGSGASGSRNWKRSRGGGGR